MFFYLENRETFRFTLKAGEAIRANRLGENLPLVCIYQDSMTIAQIDSLVRHDLYSIYPVVISEDFPCIVSKFNEKIYQLYLNHKKCN